jgi:bacteriorhodopsin
MSSTLMIILSGLLFWFLTCVAVIDIARKDFGGIEKKAAWGFASLVPFIGPIVYFTIGRKMGKRKVPAKSL